MITSFVQSISYSPLSTDPAESHKKKGPRVSRLLRIGREKELTAAAAKWKRAFKDWLYWEDWRGWGEGGRIRLGDLGDRSGEFCVCFLFVST